MKETRERGQNKKGGEHFLQKPMQKKKFHNTTQHTIIWYDDFDYEKRWKVQPTRFVEEKRKGREEEEEEDIFDF